MLSNSQLSPLLPGFENDLRMKLLDLSPNLSQDVATFARQSIILSGPLATAGLGLALEPAQPGHSIEQRIERAGTDIVTVAAQLVQNPLTVDRFRIRVMQN